MGITTRVTASAIAACTTALLASAAFAQSGPGASGQEGRWKGCTNATLRGGFGFSAEGALLAVPAPFAGPFGEIGRQSFDGEGHTAGTGTLSANGHIVRVIVEGTYAVNPDCTGAMTLFILPFGTTAGFDFVIDDDGDELRAIAADDGAVETRVYRKQSRGRND
jgi:hypothetical protein